MHQSITNAHVSDGFQGILSTTNLLFFRWLFLKQPLQRHKRRSTLAWKKKKKSSTNETRQSSSFFFMFCQSCTNVQTFPPTTQSSKFSSLNTARDTVIKHRTSHNLNQPPPSLLVYSSRMWSYY